MLNYTSIKNLPGEEPVKIAFLMQESRMGGIEYNALHLAQALHPNRFSVTFLCPEDGKLPSLLLEKKIPVVFYTRPPFFSTSLRLGKWVIFNPAATLFNFVAFPFIAFGLALLIRRHQFKVIITKGLLANFYGSLSARLSGISCVWDMQEIVSGKRVFGLMNNFLNGWAKIFANKIIVPAAATRDQFWPDVQSRTDLIPNGIDTKRYSPGIDSQAIRKEWGIKPDEILIGHIARFTYWKGQKDFVKAAVEIAKKVPHVKFVLVGSPVFEGDAFEKEILMTVRESGLKDFFLFPGFRDDLANVMAGLDIFIHCSIEAEGCPITLITGMSMGKACVVTKVEGNNEIVSKPGEQAMVVLPGRPDEIAKAVMRIIKDQGLKNTLETNARARILERYSLEDYSKATAEVIEKLVA